jgi:opacity protein-like surface antigen
MAWLAGHRSRHGTVYFRRMSHRGDVMRRNTYLIGFVILAAALPASAQDDDKRVNFTLGGGYTFSSGEVNKHLGDGYNINLGLTVNINPIIGIEGLYSFNGLGDKQLSIPVSPTPTSTDTAVPTDFFASMNMQYFTGSVVVRPHAEGKVRPFFLTGIGAYYRPVKVTTPSVGFVPGYCDPYWYVCYEGGFVATDRIVGERSSTDFGMAFGGGVTFQVAESTSLFFEVRYHYIWGNKVDVQAAPLPASVTASTTSDNTNSQFLPITFGIRF